ncbi:MAG: hypothetical protein ACRCXM_10295 [Beijerinckiaceae bacterium]
MKPPITDQLVKLCISRALYFYPVEEIGYPDLLRERLCFTGKGLRRLADDIAHAFREAGLPLPEAMLADGVLEARTVGDIVRLVETMVWIPFTQAADPAALRRQHYH